jgi:hypothetical protein
MVSLSKCEKLIASRIEKTVFWAVIGGTAGEADVEVDMVVELKMLNHAGTMVDHAGRF